MKRFVKTALSTLSFLGLSLAATAAFADPDPSQVYIEGFEHQGDGCRPGTTAANISPDRKAITVLFSNYVVEGGTQSAARREEVLTLCQMLIKMRVPAGWQFSIHEIHYRGYASIDARTWGRQSSTYRWAADQEFKPLAFMRFIGPYNGDYDNVSRAQGITWAPCRPNVPSTKHLIIRSHIGVKGVRGYMTVDSLDHEVKEQYRIQWRPCRA